MPAWMVFKKPHVWQKNAPKFPFAMPKQIECFLERCFPYFDNGKKGMVYVNATWTYLLKGKMLINVVLVEKDGEIV